MKKVAILTSVLALAACGGGSGGGDGVYTGSRVSVGGGVTPAIRSSSTMFAMDSEPSVMAGNTSLTGMASYTVATEADEDLMQTLVENALGTGNDIYSEENYNSVRSGSRSHMRSGTALSGTPEQIAVKKKAIIAAKIGEAKQVLYEMVNSSNPEAYVSNNKGYVIDALKLFGVTLSGDETNAELADAFVYNAEQINKDNVLSAFDAFDSALGFSKKTMAEDVVLRGAGSDSAFQFDIDINGKIKSVALVEVPDYESKTNYDHKRYSYDYDNVNEKWVLSRVDNTANEGLKVTKEGVFTRSTSDDTKFNTTYYEYSVALDDNIESAPIKCTYKGTEYVLSAEDKANLNSADSYADLKFYSTDGDLSGEDLKAAALQALLMEADKHYAGQGGGDADAIGLSRAKLTAIIEWYINQLNYKDDADFSHVQIDAVAALTGMGKDVGLKYADFGYATLTETVHTSPDPETNKLYTPYAGGYDERRMDSAVADGMTFTGTVIATVEHTRYDTGSPEYKKDMLVSGNGELTYSTTTGHTLGVTNLKGLAGTDYANKDWYDITINQNGSDPTFTFNGTGKDIPEEFQFFKADIDGDNMTVTPNAGTAANDYTDAITTWEGKVIRTDGAAAANNDNAHSVGFETEYYGGVGATAPTEATGRFSYSQEAHTNNNSHTNEVSVYGAFGGVAQSSNP